MVPCLNQSVGHQNDLLPGHAVIAGGDADLVMVTTQAPTHGFLPKPGREGKAKMSSTLYMKSIGGKVWKEKVCFYVWPAGAMA